MTDGWVEVKDPRRSLVIWMPGLATHFEKGYGTACGTSAPKDRVVKDPAAVDCRKCLRTKAWLAAWSGGQRVREAIEKAEAFVERHRPPGE